MFNKLSNLKTFLSIGIIINFCLGILNFKDYVFSIRHIQYGMYRLILGYLQDALNKNVVSIIILVVCFYFSLLISIFLVNKFCRPIFKRIFKIHTLNRHELIRAYFSTAISLFFLVYEGWLINWFITLNWYIPDNKIALIILILLNIAILPITTLLWSLLMQGRWEKLWGLILKLRNPCLVFFRIATMILVFFHISLNLLLSIDRVINSPKGPNVILISIDTLRADHLGCYGYEKNITPNIDNFAKEGVLFNNCIAQAPETTASHGSIFTSLIPVHHKASQDNRSAISSDVVTISEIFRNYNYSVISFNDDGQVGARFGFYRGFHLYDSTNREKKFKNTVEDAKEWIKNNRKKKLFLFLHTYEIHTPYDPFLEYLNKIEVNYRGNLGNVIEKGDYFDKINDGRIKINSQDLQHIVNLYDAEILSMDEAFSVLIDFLKKEDIYDDSIIIFTSDHGEAFGEHGKIATHGDILYDECLKVPLIIKFPNSKWAGKVIQEQVRSIDILPTIIEELNFRRFSYFEGISLESLIKGEKFEETLFALSQKDLVGYPSSSLRTNRWKWHEDYEERLLFNLENDPLEERDVSSENKEIVEFLENKLNEIINSKEFSRVVNEDIEKVHIDDDLQEQLRSLGYL